MREPMRRFLAYSYRNLSDSDLKHLLAFLESSAGKRYVTAYNASMGAGFDAMGKRTGEQLGESLRELAQAHLDARRRGEPGTAGDRAPRIASGRASLGSLRLRAGSPSSARKFRSKRADRLDAILQAVIRVEHVQRSPRCSRAQRMLFSTGTMSSCQPCTMTVGQATSCGV